MHWKTKAERGSGLAPDVRVRPPGQQVLLGGLGVQRPRRAASAGQPAALFVDSSKSGSEPRWSRGTEYAGHGREQSPRLEGAASCMPLSPGPRHRSLVGHPAGRVPFIS